MTEFIPFLPKTSHETAPWLTPKDAEHSGVFPKLRKAPDGRIAVGMCVCPDGSVKADMWDGKPHANLSKLPEDLPKAARFAYTAEGQLAILRSTEWFGSTAHNAFKAWDRYLERKAT